jgi:hypothetical protein
MTNYEGWIISILMFLTTFIVCAEESELKRQRARERYSQNREEINKRRREAYKQKRTIGTESNATQTPADVSLGNINLLCLLAHHVCHSGLSVIINICCRP